MLRSCDLRYDLVVPLCGCDCDGVGGILSLNAHFVGWDEDDAKDSAAIIM
jgi:hypothetical protein